MLREPIAEGTVISGKMVDLIAVQGKDAPGGQDGCTTQDFSIYLAETNIRIGTLTFSVECDYDGIRRGRISYDFFANYKRKGYEAKACELAFQIARAEELPQVDIDVGQENRGYIIESLRDYRTIPAADQTGHDEPSPANDSVQVDPVSKTDANLIKLINAHCVIAYLFLGMSCSYLLASMIFGYEQNLIIMLGLLIPCFPVFDRSHALFHKRKKMPPKKWLTIDIIGTTAFSLLVIAVATLL